MAANFDNSAAPIPGTVRDGTTGAVLVVNSDGSINTNNTGTKNTASGSVATLLAWLPGTIRDPVSGTILVVNSDGSINTATA